MNARCDICRAPVFFTTYEEVPECPYCLRVLCPKHEKFGFCEEHFSRLTEADQQAIIHLAKDIEKTNVKLTIDSFDKFS